MPLPKLVDNLHINSLTHVWRIAVKLLTDLAQITSCGLFVTSQRFGNLPNSNCLRHSYAPLFNRFGSGFTLYWRLSWVAFSNLQNGTQCRPSSSTTKKVTKSFEHHRFTVNQWVWTFWVCVMLIAVAVCLSKQRVQCDALWLRLPFSIRVTHTNQEQCRTKESMT